MREGKKSGGGAFKVPPGSYRVKHLKGGKASGVDGLAVEHFLYADRHIYVYLSLMLNSFVSRLFASRIHENS